METIKSLSSVQGQSAFYLL